VSGTAALLVALGQIIIHDFEAETGHTMLQVDPLRIIEAVITGVSFLGAGTILRNGSSQQVEGLTTAASLLFAAALGVTVASAQLVLAVGITTLALLTLRGLNFITQRLEQR
jgi:putative Mg2+ transporter-C (MgtC) family protein